MNDALDRNITPKSLASVRHLNRSDCTFTREFRRVSVLDNAKKVPWKKRKDVELELIWKDHIAYLGESKIYVYEENNEHAIACKCCTPLSVCNANDEERQRHNIKSKIKRPDTNTQHIDRGILFPKVNIPIEQKSESLTMQFPKEDIFSV